MSLKNRFRLVFFSMIALLASISILAVTGIRHTRSHLQEVAALDDLIVDLYELRILGGEYSGASSARVKQQWEIKYGQIRSTLAAQRQLPEEVTEAVEGLRSLIARLAPLNEAPEGPSASQERLRRQIALALNLEAQRVIDWASDSSSQSKARIVSHLLSMGGILLAVALLVAIVTTTVITTSGSHILASITRLKDGAHRIASGQLGFQVASSGSDELASLTAAVNRMSLDLKGSYEHLVAQTDEIATEMAEKQAALEQLQKNTAELEEEIEQRQAMQQSLEMQARFLVKEVAERERIQEEHARLEEQLRQSQKMEAIGLLAGGIAHDFNNILSVIMGYGDLLVTVLPEGKARDSAGQILKASVRAADLTRGLLAFSRKQTFTLERTDLNQLAIDNCKFLQRVIGEDIALVTAFHPAPLFSLLDRSQIQQVLMNLATNARDAMPAGGTLTISLARESPDGERVDPRHGHPSPGDRGVLTMSDTGTGMDPKVVERIFEPFFTTKEKGKGTGLGLSIVHGIVAQHLGDIRCSSAPGTGTTFSIHLPLCEEPGPAAVDTPESSGANLRGNETILLAEDDPALMEMTRGLLESNGYQVLQAQDGAQAVALFAQQRDAIDLVLLDAIMPKLSGKQAWDEIAALRPGVKACFISGYAQDITSGRLAVDPSLPLISKPFKPATLLKKVRELLDGPS